MDQLIWGARQFIHRNHIRGIPSLSPDQELTQMLTQEEMMAAPLLLRCPLNQQLQVFPPNRPLGKNQLPLYLAN